MAETAIRADRLTKYYGTNVGIKELTLDIYKGEVFGFLGPNGAGKTTFLRTLMGMFKPTSGTASLLGYDSWRESVEVNRQVAYLSGNAPLYGNLSGADHVDFIAALNRIDRGPGVELADRFDLDLRRRVSEYSSGMRQKLALTLVFMKQAQLLIMDEPTNALDPLLQQMVYQELRDQRSRGATVLFSSHNLPEVERIADRVGIIRDGSLVSIEKIQELGGKRLRNIELIYEGPAPFETLEKVSGITDLVKVSESRLRFHFKGDLNPLLQLLNTGDIADLNISHASLEDTFMEYYGPRELQPSVLTKDQQDRKGVPGFRKALFRRGKDPHSR